MASIKTKLLVYFGALLIVICSGLGFISYCMASNSLVSNAEDVLPQFAAAAAKVVESRVDGQLSTLEAVANMDGIKDLNSGIESKLAILAQESQRNGHIKMGIADLDGNYKTTKGENLNIKDRAHFKNAIAGERYISDPIVSKTDNSMIVTTAVPIKSQDKIIGVLVAVRDGNELSYSTKTNEMANQSNANMTNMIDTVSRLRDGFESFSKKILGFGHNVNQINEITNLINSIADQTDLLALNAAIEAARAGDAGRGFAVVADEIRKLAEQSKDSSANISTLVNAISADTETIVHSANSMNHDLNKQLDVINITIDSFQKIIQSIGEMGPKIEAVNESAEMLNSEKDIILEKIEGAASVAQEVSASTEEIAASSEEMSASTENVASTANTLNNMTKEMMIQVEKFKI